jgi:hypothetical protein
MKGPFYKICFVALASLVTLISCKKETGQNMPTVVGVWSLTELGRDLNSNNAIDSGETDVATASRVKWIVNFNDNNTFTQVSNAFGNKEGKWSVNNMALVTMSPIDTINYTVHSISPTELKLLRKDSQTFGSWYIFVK